MPPVVVTSYTEPDLDGFACAVAYAEFLNKTGTPAVFRFFGEPHIEARYLVRKYSLAIQEDASASLEKVALVDASELRDLDKFIKPEEVCEIIDHRKMNDAALFKNAKVQIEFVGSAATLIAERFSRENIAISHDAAVLLYGAIVSNTLNFRAKVTTDRDRAMSVWLNQTLKLEDDFAHDMFQAKSDVTGEKLVQRIEADFAWFQFGDKKIGCAQLEIINAEVVARGRTKEIIDILHDLTAKDSLHDTFASFIDLSGGNNIFIAEQPDLQAALTETLEVTFKDSIAIRPGFIMRKEITPLLRSYFENKTAV